MTLFSDGLLLKRPSEKPIPNSLSLLSKMEEKPNKKNTFRTYQHTFRQA